MAFAIVADEMIRKGEIRDYAELARIGQVSRARVTQIMALNNLAPSIQEALLFLPATDGPEPVTERQMRAVVVTSDWSEQALLWEAPRTAWPRRGQPPAIATGGRQRNVPMTSELTS
jgi:hypothetical protein